MKSKTILSASLFAVLGLQVLSSCNGSSVDTVKTIESSYDHEDKAIELIGEFDAPIFTFSSGGSPSMAMNFVVKPHVISSEKFIVTNVMLPTGTEKNSVLFELPADQKKYTLKNFYVFDKDGNKINLDTHTTFKMTGKVHYSELEKPEKERDNTNFSYKITDVSFEKD